MPDLGIESVIIQKVSDRLPIDNWYPLLPHLKRWSVCVFQCHRHREYARTDDMQDRSLLLLVRD